ncbi:gag/pol protein [Cucumis melo var. makuwa]|uniref:Gag/pol protein n=1 Tax=Cucumis melo var. makuwa TaxID=1194695 RepID=A0A5D3C780_CUCMM|nr:gag/pol protein [Cucumis melo var. makuwa]TYK07285.1 gag/pol protein [Cucumis melo var. makuwa]
MSDVLAKKNESLATAKEIMDSLKGMFGKPEWSLKQEAIEYIYTKRMKEGTSVREHVLDMMMHFNITKVNGGSIDEANKVSFILESLLKSFIPFQTNVSLNKIEFNLITLLNELQRFQNLTKDKRKEVEANVATTKRKRGLSSKSKAGPSKPKRKIEKKGKGKTPKQNKVKKTTEKGKCYHCGENGHWLRNCPKYLAQKKNRERSTRKIVLGKGFLRARSLSKLELEKWSQLKQIDRLVKSGLLSLRAKTPLELVHSNLFGPMNVKAWGGYEYFISFNDYSRYGHVYLIQSKFDSFEKFKEYKVEVENESGYTKESKAGLFYDPQENKVFVSINATFLEEDYIRNHQTRSKLVLEEIFKNTTDRPSSSTKVVDKTRNIGQTHPSQELGEPRRSGRVVRQPDCYLGLSEAQIIIPDDGIEDPLTYKQAMNDVDCNQWIKVIDLEMESMYSNSIWTLVDQPNDVKPIVVNGSTRENETKLMDVKTTFLNGNLEESIYMVQPEGFIQKGQEQKIINSTVAFLVLYVDDILLIGNDVGHLTDIKKWLATQFQMKDLGNAQYVLGIQIVQNRKNKTLAMSQTSYIDKMLSRYKMQNSKKDLLPYRYGIHLSKEQCPKTPQEVEDMSNIPYASAVGSPIYIDSDFQTDKDARKSISGSVFTLNGEAVVWRSIKQLCIVDSTIEVEYVAAWEAAKEVVWLKKFLTDLEVVPNMHLPITLYCDNSGAVANS